MMLRFLFHDKSNPCLEEREEEVPDNADGYTLGEVFAKHLQPFIQANTGIEMTVSSETFRHNFKVISKKAGALVIEED